MPQARKYGVACKNRDCNAAIIFGHYLTDSNGAGDKTAAVEITPGRLRCVACGQEYDYTQQDLQQFNPGNA